jgi:DNA repair protein RadC
MLGRKDVLAYVESLADELREWLLVFFVDHEFGLLAAETVARGSVSEIRVDCAGIVRCGMKLGAAGMILVHNHPSGDSTPSHSDIKFTRRLAYVSREMEIPLLDHFVVASDGMRSVGYW